MRKVTQLLGLVVAMAAAVPVMAADYYIDPANGNDAAYDGTSPTVQSATVGPWRSFRNIGYYTEASFRPANWRSLQAGDTVFLRGGNYTDVVDWGISGIPEQNVRAVAYVAGVHGTQTQPIRFLPYAGERPILDPGNQGFGFFLRDSSWVELAGVTVQNANGDGAPYQYEGGGVVVAWTDHVVLHGLDVHGTDGNSGANVAGLHCNGVNDIEVYDSVFYDNYDHTGLHPENSCHIVFFLGGGRVAVHDNLFYNTAASPGTGVKYKHASVDPEAQFVVYDNVFRNVNMFSFGSGTPNAHFHHNIVIGGGDGVWVYNFGGDAYPIVDQVIEYNTFYMTGGYACFLIPESEPENIAFRNNIIYDVREPLEYGFVSPFYLYKFISDEIFLASARHLDMDDNVYFSPHSESRIFFGAEKLDGVDGYRGVYPFTAWRALAVDAGGGLPPVRYDQSSLVVDPDFLLVDMNLASYDRDSPAFRPSDPAVASFAGAYAGLGPREPRGLRIR